MIPNFSEMSGIHKKLKLPNEELGIAQQSWKNDRGRQLLGYDILPVLADFLTNLEVKALASFSAASIREAVGCTYEQAQALLGGQMVPFNVIAEIAAQLYFGDSLLLFAEEWEAQYAEDQQLPRFGPAFIRIRDQIGVTNHQLAIAMNIRAPEKREQKEKKTNRAEPFRLSNLIRETLENAHNSRIATAGVLMGLLSHAAAVSEDPIHDPTEELRSAFTDFRSRSLKRSGASMHSNPLRLARDYWGMERDDLADALNMNPEDIVAMEKSDDTVPLRVLRALEKLGAEKLEPAQKRWIELIQPPEPTTVRSLIIHLQRKAGSFQALVSRLKANKQDSKIGVSNCGFVTMANGSFVRSWPMLQRICAQSDLLEFPSAEAEPLLGEELNTHEKLRRDWSVKYADALFEKGKTVVLARSLHLMYGEHAESLRAFTQNNMSQSIPTQVRIMQDIEAEESVQWLQVSRTLDAAGLSLNSAQYQFIKNLYETGSIEEALIHARIVVETDEAFEHESYHFGLTTKERKKYGLKV